MNENPYQAPESEIANGNNIDQVPFYIVSIPKFTFLFFATLGAYSIYWFYLNWLYYKQNNHSRIWPVPRAIFNVFFTHSLFGKVQLALDEAEKTFDWTPKIAATIYVILTIAGNITERLSFYDIGMPYTAFLSILLLPPAYIVLVTVQKAINLSQNDPEGRSNNNYTIGNYIWFFIGALLWLLTIASLLFPVTGDVSA